MKGILTLVAFCAAVAVSTTASAKPWLALDMNSWNTLKEMCENYKDFGAQVPPEDIQVKCESVIMRTQIIGTEEIAFPSSGTVSMAITSSKANVHTNVASNNVDPVKVACPVIAQVKQVASGMFPSSCAELKACTGSFVDFCLEKLRSGNYTGEAEVVAGSQKSLCNKKH